MARLSPSLPPTARSYRVAAATPLPHGGALVLMLLGTLLFVLGGAVMAYPRWAEWQHYARQPARPADTQPAAAAATPGTGRGAAATALASAPPADLRRRPLWITIPRIGVDTSITEVIVEDGAYQVPAFDVGHHADSANPGEVGNSVFNGHLTTLDAGQVFKELHRLAAGDTLQVRTPIYRTEWVVEDVRVVPATDSSYIQPGADRRITLYTCTGTYDPRTRDYSHRLVVVARLAQVVPQTT
jgi:LPXTG-site transpeptidase (sortase) family protein